MGNSDDAEKESTGSVGDDERKNAQHVCPDTPIRSTRKDVDQPTMIGDYTIEYLVERAHKKIDKRTADWEVLNHTLSVPKLNRAELEIGRELGEGGFFKVHEVRKIVLFDDGADDTETEAAAAESKEIEELVAIARTQSDDLGVVQNRRYMQKHCVRVGRTGKQDCRYALKSMKKNALTDPGLFVNSLVDLAIEARFLSAISHPNILKLRGLSQDFIDDGANSFIILDRLYETLTDRISYWKDRRDNGFVNFFDFRGKKQKAFLAERLAVGFDIASALEYLHDRNIIYRDLKPDNVGFDVRQDAKLFDFGLATEFDKEKHGTYKLTGDTGTIRYMAPEVAQEQSYSEKADVYSFGILLWQLLSLETPYGKLHGGKIEYSVCHLNLRPKLDNTWPKSMIKLLEDCWARNPPRRPTMEVVCSALEREASSLTDKKMRDQEWMDASKTALSARYFEN